MTDTAPSAADRPGATAPRAPQAWNATLDTRLAHRSVRACLPDPLPGGWGFGLA
jgi:hypothetical protein